MYSERKREEMEPGVQYLDVLMGVTKVGVANNLSVIENSMWQLDSVK